MIVAYRSLCNPSYSAAQPIPSFSSSSHSCFSFPSLNHLLLRLPYTIDNNNFKPPFAPPLRLALAFESSCRRVVIRSRGYVSVLALAEPTAPDSAWMSGGSVDVIQGIVEVDRRLELEAVRERRGRRGAPMVIERGKGMSKPVPATIR